jgi:hypothetical protein
MSPVQLGEIMGQLPMKDDSEKAEFALLESDLHT